MCGKGKRDGTKDFRYLEFQREGGRGDEFLSRKLEAEATGRYERIVLPFGTFVLAGIFFPLEKNGGTHRVKNFLQYFFSQVI